MLSELARLLRHGGPGLKPDPSRSACLYNEAAEAATEALKAKLAQKYYELGAEEAAEAEEEGGGGEGADWLRQGQVMPNCP